MRFEVLAGETVIGWSEFEFGDPPMGVVHGRFHPNQHYRSTQHARSEARLRARPDGSDEFFASEGSVFIEDRSDELGSTEVEVRVLGLDGDTYERHFAHRTKAYEASLRPG